MSDQALAAAVREALDTPRDAFQAAAEREATELKEAVAEGTFDNSEGLVGLEYEFYAVRGQDPAATGGTNQRRGAGTLARVPRRTLAFTGFEKELGLHNAEMRTMPQPHNRYGLAAQGDEVRARLSMARRAVTPNDIRLVSDGIWTIPPVGETAAEYLGDSVEIDGVRLATNMSDSVRYHAMANVDVEIGKRIDAPNVSFEADTIMPESLITSIQPHYQVPRASALAEYFRYALRIAGPLLALGANSPLFPPSLYGEDATVHRVVDEAHQEHRIDVFESVLNGPDVEKVRFPRDVTTTEAAIDRIAADPTFVPMTVEDQGRFDDQFAHFRHKHGTYWRWVRPVFDGASETTANARIEFRPLPGQPTVRDTVALQAAVSGALAGLHAAHHPVAELPWSTARENFYAAKRDGLEADLTWITAEGAQTDDIDAIYDDLFEHIEVGLRGQLLPDERVEAYLAPLRDRVDRRRTPARWRLDIARRLADEGHSLEATVAGVQRAYLTQQWDTLLEGSFASWPSPEAVAVPDAT